MDKELFLLVAGGDEEYIYMNKVTVHKQQGDQEIQDKGRELMIDGCVMSNGVMEAHVVRALFYRWRPLWQLWGLRQSMVWKDYHFHNIRLEIVVLANTVRLFLEVALWRLLFWDKSVAF